MLQNRTYSFIVGVERADDLCLLEIQTFEGNNKQQ